MNTFYPNQTMPVTSVTVNNSKEDLNSSKPNTTLINSGRLNSYEDATFVNDN